ncbi:MAG: hypothetical protein QOI25_5007 [Mycobacterium sp.]|nr:hypothetical protein [Mycobacterium sp.]
MPYDPGVTDMDRTPRGDPNASWPDAERIAVPETKPYRNASHKVGAAGHRRQRNNYILSTSHPGTRCSAKVNRATGSTSSFPGKSRSADAPSTVTTPC